MSNVIEFRSKRTQETANFAGLEHHLTAMVSYMGVYEGLRAGLNNATTDSRPKHLSNVQYASLVRDMQIWVRKNRTVLTILEDAIVHREHQLDVIFRNCDFNDQRMNFYLLPMVDDACPLIISGKLNVGFDNGFSLADDWKRAPIGTFRTVDKSAPLRPSVLTDLRNAIGDTSKDLSQMYIDSIEIAGASFTEYGIAATPHRQYHTATSLVVNNKYYQLGI